MHSYYLDRYNAVDLFFSGLSPEKRTWSFRRDTLFVFRPLSEKKTHVPLRSPRLCGENKDCYAHQLDLLSYYTESSIALRVISLVVTKR